MTESDATQTPSRRGLPGWLKAVIWIVVILGVIALLFTVVFPWVDQNLLNNPTLDAAARQHPA